VSHSQLPRDPADYECSRTGVEVNREPDGRECDRRRRERISRRQKTVGVARSAGDRFLRCRARRASLRSTTFTPTRTQQMSIVADVPRGTWRAHLWRGAFGADLTGLLRMASTRCTRASDKLGTPRDEARRAVLPRGLNSSSSCLVPTAGVTAGASEAAAIARGPRRQSRLPASATVQSALITGLFGAATPHRCESVPPELR
jgi:hypothetical protein